MLVGFVQFGEDNLLPGIDPDGGFHQPFVNLLIDAHDIAEDVLHCCIASGGNHPGKKLVDLVAGLTLEIDHTDGEGFRVGFFQIPAEAGGEGDQGVT